MAKGFGVSPLTNTIYYGVVNKEKHMFTGRKEDVTDEVIQVVFQWFVGNMKKGGIERKSYKITYEGSDYELEMKKILKNN